MPDTTAITIVSIGSGAVVAIAGSALSAHLARRQAARQFAHEREMVDRKELRGYLTDVLATLQDALDYILGLASDLDAIATLSDAFSAEQSAFKLSRWTRGTLTTGSSDRFDAALAEQAEAITVEIEKLRSHFVGLALLVGTGHPLSVAFTDLLRRTIACREAVPTAFPGSDEERKEFEVAWTFLADGQREFLGLAARLVGVKLELATV